MSSLAFALLIRNFHQCSLRVIEIAISSEIGTEMELKTQTIAILLALSLIAQSARTAPPAYELIWLRIKSDPKLKSLFEWTEFAAQKGDTLAETLEKRKLETARANQQLHLYRLEEIDLNTKIGALGLKQRERLYLTDEDLMDS